MGSCLIVELWKPRFQYAVLSRSRLEDSVWYVLNEVVYTALIGWLSYHAAIWSEGWFRGIQLSVDLTGLNLLVQYIIFFIFLDAVSFSFHYLAHRIDFLWETHKIHHAITELSFLSAFRHSWSQKVLEYGFFAIISGWMDFSNEVRMWGNMTFVTVCMLQHLNVSFRFPKIIETIIITPKNHFWHHTKYKHKPWGQNFGLIFAHWDHLCGTYYNPDHFNDEIGTREEVVYTSFFNKVFRPFDNYVKSAVKKFF